MMTRRWTVGGLGLAALGALGWRGLRSEAQAGEPEGDFEMTLSEAEWRARLTPAQFRVLRQHATERAFTSPLNAEKRSGIYECAGCDLPVFASDAKFDSGTGWPSFWAPISPDAIGTSLDRSFFMVRTEVHCARCGGHLGHVFKDGPPPTGLRYCMNGVAMTFKPTAEARS